VQVSPTTLPLCTRSFGPFAAEAVVDEAEDSDFADGAALLSSSIVPVSSSFLPTCGVSADPFAIS